jgi:UDP-glucose 4-epimerase
MHNNINENRIIILGARGFVGRTICQRLVKDRRKVLPLDKQTLDLLHIKAAEQLFDLLCETDILVIAVAEAPCKTSAMFYHNISMIYTVCEALKNKPVSHIIYISSDAV